MTQGQVYVVDDDVFIRQSVCDLVESVGIAGRSFGTAEEFLDSYVEDRPTAVVIDVRLPGVGGLAIQESLRAMGATAPVIFVTAYGDAWTAVQAMKGGAFDFLEKPVNDHELLNRIQAAVMSHAEKLKERDLKEVDKQVDYLTLREVGILMRVEPDGLEQPAADGADGPPTGWDELLPVGGLTPRQQEILMALKNGESNKEIGRQLGIQESTVKIQLKAIYRHLGVSNRTQAAVVANRRAGGHPGAPPATEYQES